MSKVERSKALAEYTEDLKQNWTTDAFNKSHRDQFQFRIDYSEKGYRLYWKEQFICQTAALVAAKEISRVLLNDKILHHPVQ